MEFDATPPPNDEARRLAESKKLTLKPLHGNITPNAPSDTEIATRHILDPAIANIPIDTEQNATLIQPSAQTTQSSAAATDQPTRPSTKVIICVLALVCALATASYFIFVG